MGGNGADSTAKDNSGMTALHYVARYNTSVHAPAICKVLLDNGADSTAKDNSDLLPPLLYSVTRRPYIRVPAFNLFFTHQIRSRNHDQATPLFDPKPFPPVGQRVAERARGADRG